MRQREFMALIGGGQRRGRLPHARSRPNRCDASACCCHFTASDPQLRTTSMWRAMDAAQEIATNDRQGKWPLTSQVQA